MTTLSNGLKVASVDCASPMSRIGLFFKSGSRYENLENRGISHVLRAGAFLVGIALFYEEQINQKVIFQKAQNSVGSDDMLIMCIICFRPHLIIQGSIFLEQWRRMA